MTDVYLFFVGHTLLDWEGVGQLFRPKCPCLVLSHVLSQFFLPWPPWLCDDDVPAEGWSNLLLSLGFGVRGTSSAVRLSCIRCVVCCASHNFAFGGSFVATIMDHWKMFPVNVWTYGMGLIVFVCASVQGWLGTR